MNKYPRRSAQPGFSARNFDHYAIICGGLMGFAAMMINSEKNNRIAMQRSLATLYAYDIIDCMRVNQAAALVGAYTLGSFRGSFDGHHCCCQRY